MPTSHSGFLIQSSHGHRGNFELVVPSVLGGVIHGWRDNDSPELPWFLARPFGCGAVSAVSLIQSEFADGSGQLEAVARVGTVLQHYWLPRSEPQVWQGPTRMMAGVSGNAALIQCGRGAGGRFELVVPLEGGGLAHCSREGERAGLAWSAPSVFGGRDRFEAVALLHSDLGDRSGRLELLARIRDRLVHFWRDCTGPWHGPAPVAEGTSGVPALLQNREGERGAFELVAPRAGAGLVHLRRDHGAPDKPWLAPVYFGGLQPFDAVALIQSNFGAAAGNLEVVARTDVELRHFWRDDTAPFAWHAGGAVGCRDRRAAPEREGEWRTPFATGTVGIHAALLPTHHALFFGYHPEDPERGEAAVLHPRSGALERAEVAAHPLGSGHAFLPDGSLLTVGGCLRGLRARRVFRPAGTAGSWERLADMPSGRWYPTCATLPDGRVFALGGARSADPAADAAALNASYEIFPGPSASAPVPAQFLRAAHPYALAPFVLVLPTQQLLLHAGAQTHLLDLAKLDSGELEALAPRTQRAEPRTYPLQGSCVLLPLLPEASPAYRARVLLLGGGGLPLAPTSPAAKSCEILDLGADPLAWRECAPMPNARVMPDAVLLPDGSVLVVNGSSTGSAGAARDPVLAADVYDPQQDRWWSWGAMRVPRLHHATALLLPDGRVLVAGHDREFNSGEYRYAELRAELFSPPYLFRGPRPELKAAPELIRYGEAFAVEVSPVEPVERVALLRCGSVSRSFNADQRYVGLAIAKRTASRLVLEAPPTGTVAPPGPYLLFALNPRGVPSLGRMLRLG